MPKKLEILSTKTLLDDFFVVEEARLRHELYDGGMSPELRRLSFERGDSVAAVLRHHDTGDFVLVEQFRYPASKHGQGWLVELVAGSVEQGEDPEATIRREITEETGYQLTHLEKLVVFYTSPGGTSERIFLYRGEVRERSETELRSDEHEDIKVLRWSEQEVRLALDQNRIADAKTIIGLQLIIGSSWLI